MRQTSLLVFLLATALNGQQPSASVVGRVTDSTGAVIPGVAIKIINLDTAIAQTGSSNQVGDFTIPYLNPGRYALNDARADSFGFVLDGVENTEKRNTGAMINPPIEGVQEFKLITSGFSAEYGKYAGGVLSVVTKSGTNRLRGSVYEFLRNDMFDARSFFDVEKSKLRRNQFGATVGGPVLLPKIYNGRNRTFFLVTWDSLRSITGKTQRGITPVPEMLSGDFSKATDAFG